MTLFFGESPVKAEDLQRGEELISSYFQDDHYLNRFDSFVAGVERIVSRYGGHFDREAYRTDIAAALFLVGVKNSNRRAVSAVQSELALYMTYRQSFPSEKNTLEINDIVELKPNFYGLGIDFNALIRSIRKWHEKAQKRKTHKSVLRARRCAFETPDARLDPRREDIVGASCSNDEGKIVYRKSFWGQVLDGIFGVRRSQ